MSVPLDRLYNFLHDVCNRDDIIIYRFFPHGSRKIEDLSMLPTKFDYNIPKFLVENNIKCVFFNDQEPLNFDFYRWENPAREFFNQNKCVAQEVANKLIAQHQETLSKYGPDINLKIVTSIGTWLRPAIIVHSEKNSIELDKYQNSGLYPGESFVGVYWWCHAVIARDWFRYAQVDTSLKNQKSVTHDFLIYNRAWTGTREYRLKFTELLLENNLVEHCKTWFNKCDSGKLYHEHAFQNPDFQIKNFNLQDYFAETTSPATASADYNSNDYQCTSLEIVLETLFDDKRLHLTEKSLRPIACGQPFILAATAGSLEYLRSYGFETFDGLINEDYDTIQDPLKRLQAICAEMKRISQLSDAQKEQMFKSLNQIALRNQQKFFSADWQQSIINEFKDNMELACKKIDGMLKYPV